jgi:predicted extracellular nuclease
VEVGGERRLPANARPLPKRLLLDFARLGVPLDNVEGMAFGPPLADGRQSLVMVSDDNFAAHQRTQVLAFALDVERLGEAPDGLAIGDLQGAGHRTPLLDRRVVGIAGVVTAVVPAEGGGVHAFWIEDPGGDGDPDTSDAIHVAGNRGAPFEVAPGDEVRVTGRVGDVARAGGLPTTLLVTAGVQDVTVVARGRALPGPAVVGAGGVCPPRPVIDDDGLASFEPAADGIDFWEALEGMRVALVEPLVVGPTSRHGEIVLVAAACAPAAPRTARGGLPVAAGDFHPERLALDDRLVTGPPEVAVGDRFTAPVTGVLDYSFGNFKLLNTGPLPAVERSPLPAERLTLDAGPGDLTVASFNVENLSAVDPQEKVAALAQALVGPLGAPAVVALQEVQDDSGPADDGTVSAAATLERLVTAVAAAGGPRYAWRQVDPQDNADGGAPGANIRVALLFDPARVEPVDRGEAGPWDAAAVVAGPDGPLLSPSPGRVAPDDAAFTGAGHAGWEGSRKPLAMEARFAGRPLFLVANHLRSKGGDDPLFGAFQPPRVPTEEQRTAQATAVAAFAAELLAADPGARVVVLGDLNDHPFSPPLARLEAVGLVNLTAALPEEDRYTYVYEGNSQVLDHVLVSPALAAGARADAVHLHADFPASRRASDHDPVVARWRPAAPSPP